MKLNIKSEPSEPIENIFIKQEIFDDPLDIWTVKTESPENSFIESFKTHSLKKLIVKKSIMMKMEWFTN